MTRSGLLRRPRPPSSLVPYLDSLPPDSPYLLPPVDSSVVTVSTESDTRPFPRSKI